MASKDQPARRIFKMFSLTSLLRSFALANTSLGYVGEIALVKGEDEFRWKVEHQCPEDNGIIIEVLQRHSFLDGE